MYVDTVSNRQYLCIHHMASLHKILCSRLLHMISVGIVLVTEPHCGSTWKIQVYLTIFILSSWGKPLTKLNIAE